MKTLNLRTFMITLMTVGLIAAGSAAYAGKGMGAGDREPGRYQRGYGCVYGEPGADLTPEQREQMEAERQAFFDATRTDRQDLYAKSLELRAEMAKREPDMQKASALQKEISDLQGQLDQKHLNHIANMRKINPDAGMGFFGGGRGMGHHDNGRGYGHHGRGSGMGMGYGPGACRQ